MVICLSISQNKHSFAKLCQEKTCFVEDLWRETLKGELRTATFSFIFWKTWWIRFTNQEWKEEDLKAEKAVYFAWRIHRHYFHCLLSFHLTGKCRYNFYAKRSRGSCLRFHNYRDSLQCFQRYSFNLVCVQYYKNYEVCHWQKAEHLFVNFTCRQCFCSSGN